MRIKNFFVVLLATALVSCTLSHRVTLTSTPALPTPLVAPTPTIEQLKPLVQCSTSGSPNDFDFPSKAENFKTFTLDYLNEGGNVETLSKSLQRLQDKTNKSIGLLKYASFDINGDGANDLLIFSTIAEDVDQNNLIWVFQCKNGQYQSVGKETWWGSIWYPYEILSTEDLNGDGKQEATILVTGGGSWCHGTYMIIGFENETVVEYLNLDVDCGTKLTIDDNDNDGQKELIFTGEKPMDNSQGTASSQKFTATYRFNDAQRIYYKESETYSP